MTTSGKAHIGNKYHLWFEIFIFKIGYYDLH